MVNASWRRWFLTKGLISDIQMALKEIDDLRSQRDNLVRRECNCNLTLGETSEALMVLNNKLTKILKENLLQKTFTG